MPRHCTTLSSQISILSSTFFIYNLYHQLHHSLLPNLDLVKHIFHLQFVPPTAPGSLFSLSLWLSNHPWCTGTGAIPLHWDHSIVMPVLCSLSISDFLLHSGCAPISTMKLACQCLSLVTSVTSLLLLSFSLSHSCWPVVRAKFAIWHINQ